MPRDDEAETAKPGGDSDKGRPVRVQVLARRGNETRLRALGFGDPEAEAPVADVLELCLLSPEASFGLTEWIDDYTGRKFLMPVGVVMGEDGAPVLERTAVEWLAHAPDPARPGRVAILPRLAAFRRHLGHRASAADPVPELEAAIAASGERRHYVHLRDGDGGYRQTPTYSLTLLRGQEDYLVRGPSVRNGKSDLVPWMVRDDALKHLSKASFLNGLADWLARSPFADGLSVVPVAPCQEDRRIAVAYTAAGGRPGRPGTSYAKKEKRRTWVAARDVLARQPLVLADVRLHGTDDATRLRDNVRAFAAWGGIELVEPEPLRQRLDAAPDAEAVAQRLAELRAEVAAGAAWLCLVDFPNANLNTDTKHLLYGLLGDAVPKQSLNQSKAINPFRKAALVLNPKDGFWSGATAQRSSLLSLAMKTEIARRRLLAEHPWLPDALPYVFVKGPFPVRGVDHYAFLQIKPDGTLGLLEMPEGKAAESARRFKGRDSVLLAEIEWTDAAAEMRDAVLAGDGLLIQKTDVRVLPPLTAGRAGWADLCGVLAVPEVGGWAVGPIDNPNSDFSKGLVVRRLVGSRAREEAHVGNVMRMCVDASVHVGELTVLPAPFRMLRERIDTLKD